MDEITTSVLGGCQQGNLASLIPSYLVSFAEMPIGERVSQARTLRGMNQTQLGKAVGISAQAIQQLEAGDSHSSKHLLTIARVLRVRPEWIENGSGPMEITTGAETDLGAPNAVPVPSGSASFSASDLPNSLPLMGAGACGDDGLFEFNRGEPIAFVRRPPRLLGVRDAYAVYVCGDSMSPWREPGQTVHVNPHQPPKIGDYVLIQLKPQDESENRAAYIKKLVRRSPASLTLLQYNPNKEFSIRLDKIHSIHRILDWDELMGF